MDLGNLIQSVTGGRGGNADHAKVAGGLLQELESRPGGIGGLIQSFQNNGNGQAVQQWSQGQTQPANPTTVENGTAGTGLIDAIAQRTGLSPTVVRTGLAVVVPVLIHHVVSNGHYDAQGQPQGNPPATGNLLQSVLSRVL